MIDEGGESCSEYIKHRRGRVSTASHLDVWRCDHAIPEGPLPLDWKWVPVCSSHHEGGWIGIK